MKAFSFKNRVIIKEINYFYSVVHVASFGFMFQVFR